MSLDHLGMGEGFEFFFTQNFLAFLKPYHFLKDQTSGLEANIINYLNTFILNGTLSIHLFALAQWFQGKYISL